MTTKTVKTDQGNIIVSFDCTQVCNLFADSEQATAFLLEKIERDSPDGFSPHDVLHALEVATGFDI